MAVWATALSAPSSTDWPDTRRKRPLSCSLSRASSISAPSTAAESTTGSVFGIARIAQKPPAAAEAVQNAARALATVNLMAVDEPLTDGDDDDGDVSTLPDWGPPFVPDAGGGVAAVGDALFAGKRACRGGG